MKLTYSGAPGTGRAVALVTGVSRAKGIGAATAEIMAAEDLKLVPVCDAQAHPVGVVLADDIVLFALGLPRAA